VSHLRPPADLSLSAQSQPAPDPPNLGLILTAALGPSVGRNRFSVPNPYYDVGCTRKPTDWHTGSRELIRRTNGRDRIGAANGRCFHGLFAVHARLLLSLEIRQDRQPRSSNIMSFYDILTRARKRPGGQSGKPPGPPHSYIYRSAIYCSTLDETGCILISFCDTRRLPVAARFAIK
jgi:hypothetical protein